MWSRARWAAGAAAGTLVLDIFWGAGAHGYGGQGAGAPLKGLDRSRTAPIPAVRDGAVLSGTDTRPFRLLGVTWDDPDAHLAATVEVRTRAMGTARWSGWLKLDGDDAHGEETALRGGTAPVWVGPSDGVEVRVGPAPDGSFTLPAGLRLDLVDPGPGGPAGSAGPAPLAEPVTASQAAAAPRPAIVSRAGWGADESLSPEAPAYLPDGKVKAVVVHHTAGSNTYTCAEAPAVLRGIHAYHVQQLGWKDIGYNFLVDKCGTLYEGRKGGVDRAVLAAHAYGFNTETSGIAVLGDYTDVTPAGAVLDSVAKLAAWKLGQYGVSPTGTTTLTAGAAGRNHAGATWAKGAKLSFPTIHGHRDGYNTECPGERLYAELPTIRTRAAAFAAGTSAESSRGGAVPAAEGNVLTAPRT
ncbi:N-acetylmuramoyl-L-alanine amidase [Streptomyces cyaneogriseus]|uniref:N-acetylmuramoyl-L-alanine amidase n=1 Tax=Streptomyces cyaneogriseus TaxID=68192 RepID=UPI00069A3725